MRKRCIQLLHVSPSFYPAVSYGGPIFSTKAITDGVAKNHCISVKVLTTDTASPNNRTRLTLSDNPLTMEEGYKVRYCWSFGGTAIAPEMLWYLVSHIRSADVVHLTGPYNFPSIPTLLLCRIYRKPLLWSPRGGFQATHQWSSSPNRFVKSAFEKICAYIAPRNMTFHVTAKEEAEACLENFPDISCAIIPNSVDVPEDMPPREVRDHSRLRLAFLSRVHPKKGLDILFSALSLLPCYVTLDVYGEGEENYQASLKLSLIHI